MNLNSLEYTEQSNTNTIKEEPSELNHTQNSLLRYFQQEQNQNNHFAQRNLNQIRPRFLDSLDKSISAIRPIEDTLQQQASILQNTLKKEENSNTIIIKEETQETSSNDSITSSSSSENSQTRNPKKKILIFDLTMNKGRLKDRKNYNQTFPLSDPVFTIPSSSKKGISKKKFFVYKMKKVVKRLKFIIENFSINQKYNDYKGSLTKQRNRPRAIICHCLHVSRKRRGYLHPTYCYNFFEERFSGLYRFKKFPKGCDIVWTKSKFKRVKNNYDEVFEYDPDGKICASNQEIYEKMNKFIIENWIFFIANRIFMRKKGKWMLRSFTFTTTGKDAGNCDLKYISVGNIPSEVKKFIKEKVDIPLFLQLKTDQFDTFAEEEYPDFITQLELIESRVERKKEKIIKNSTIFDYYYKLAGDEGKTLLVNAELNSMSTFNTKAWKKIFESDKKLKIRNNNVEYWELEEWNFKEKIGALMEKYFLNPFIEKYKKACPAMVNKLKLCYCMNITKCFSRNVKSCHETTKYKICEKFFEGCCEFRKLEEQNRDYGIKVIYKQLQRHSCMNLLEKFPDLVIYQYDPRPHKIDVDMAWNRFLDLIKSNWEFFIINRIVRFHSGKWYFKSFSGLNKKREKCILEFNSLDDAPFDVKFFIKKKIPIEAFLTTVQEEMSEQLGREEVLIDDNVDKKLEILLIENNKKIAWKALNGNSEKEVIERKVDYLKILLEFSLIEKLTIFANLDSNEHLERRLKGLGKRLPQAKGKELKKILKEILKLTKKLKQKTDQVRGKSEQYDMKNQSYLENLKKKFLMKKKKNLESGNRIGKLLQKAADERNKKNNDTIKSEESYFFN